MFRTQNIEMWEEKKYEINGKFQMKILSHGKKEEASNMRMILVLQRDENSDNVTNVVWNMFYFQE